MGDTCQSVGKMLWWAEGSMEDTKERLDVVQYHLGWHLPILLHSGRHDDHSRGDTVLWEILRVF